MRFNTTIEHGQKRRAWEEAYAAYDVIAERGEEYVDGKWAPECGVETAGLDAYLRHPSATPAEMQEKIADMRKRGPLALENLCWNDEDMTRYLDGLERDLMRISRPNVSPKVADAFTVWADAHRAYWARGNWSDAESDPLMKAEDAAMYALYEVPCTTPGDFIVKAYVGLMDEYGAEGHDPEGLAFMIDAKQISDRADKARLRDIVDSDLGCCLLALGKTDFDAAEWVVQAQRFEKRVNVTISQNSQLGGKSGRGLMLGMDGPHSQMENLLQRLTANGLRMVSTERCTAIADEIEANHPELVVVQREMEAA